MQNEALTKEQDFYGCNPEAVLKNLQSLAERLGGMPRPNSHPLDCTTIIGHYADKQAATIASLERDKARLEAWNAEASGTLDRLAAFLQSKSVPYKQDWREWIDEAQRLLPSAAQDRASAPPQDALRERIQARIDYHHYQIAEADAQGYDECVKLSEGVIKELETLLEASPVATQSDAFLEAMRDGLHQAIHHLEQLGAGSEVLSFLRVTVNAQRASQTKGDVRP